MSDIIVRQLGLQPYAKVWQAMRAFTDHRDVNTQDEIWIVQHPPVFTMGQNAKPEHLLNSNNIEVVHTDRGGQVTYHGPGQLVIYLLINLSRRQLGVRSLITLMEQSVIEYLAMKNVIAVARSDAPGVYVNDAKICSVGLRVRRGCSYHGLAFNVEMNLIPFQWINPCGYPNLKVTQTAAIGITDSLAKTQTALTDILVNRLKIK